MVQERGEPHRLIGFCCLTYPLEHTEHTFPALSPACVLPPQVPFGQGRPSIASADAAIIVRQLRRYRWACPTSRVRSSSACVFPLPTPPVCNSLAGRHRTSRFPSKVFPDVHGVCDRAGSDGISRSAIPPVLPSASPYSVGTPEQGSLRPKTRPVRTPSNALERRSYERLRMTRGQCGSLVLHCMTLSFTTPRRFNPAHKEQIMKNRYSTLAFPVLLLSLSLAGCASTQPSGIDPAQAVGPTTAASNRLRDPGSVVDLAYQPSALTVAQAGSLCRKLLILARCRIILASRMVSRFRQVRVASPWGKSRCREDGIGFICSVPGHLHAGMKGEIAVAGRGLVKVTGSATASVV